MLRTGRNVLVGVLAAACAAAGAVVPGAEASAAPAPLAENCAPYPGGTTICSAEVPSFDGSPLDVDVTLPMPGTGPDHPLVVLLHGFGNDKHEWESTTDAADGADKHDWNSHWFARHGFYVLTYTARGFRDNGPSAAYQPATPAGTAPGCLPPGGSACPPAGTIRVKNKDVEIRDTQWLAALTAAAFGDLDRDRVAVSGGSYGGGESWLQAAEQAGRDSWTDFPGLPQLRLRVAVPKYPWTDLAYSLLPNGHGPDRYASAQGRPDTLGIGNPFGVGKASYVAGLYALGTANGVFDEGTPAPQTNGPEPFSAWLARVDAGEPYGMPGRVDDPVMSQLRRDFSGWHSAYYQPGWRAGRTAGREPAVLSVSGWTDDLFPAVESFRMAKRLTALDPGWPVEVVVADVGHSRARNPEPVWQQVNARAWAFLTDHLDGGGSRTPRVASYPTVCTGASTDTVTASTPESLAAGRLTVAYNESAVLPPTSGTADPNGPATDAVAPGSPAGCRTSPGPVPDGFSATSGPLPGGVTHIGIGYAEAAYTAAAPAVTAVLAARLWDVAPDGTAVLVSRGVYRFDFTGYDPYAGTVRVPFYGNHWRLPAGHRVRLDLVQVDQPTYRPPDPAVTSTLSLSGIRLRLPTVESGTATIH